MNAAAWPVVPGLPVGYPIEQQLRMLVRYAILAPSTRNTQPWRFTVEASKVTLRADSSRWQRVADRTRRELHLSLGCALENLLIAAGCAGFRHAVAYFPDPTNPDLAAVVTFTPGPRLSAAPEISHGTLQERYTEHHPFLARQVPPEIMRRLCGIAGEPGVRLELSDAPALRREVDVINVRALGTLFGDHRYREELAQVVGEGNLGGSWLTHQAGRLAIPHLNLARCLARQDSQGLLSAPLLAMIGSLADGPVDQVRSGRLLERLWLTATVHGLALQPVSQALQVEALRAELGRRFPNAGEHPQQLVRIGYAASRPSHVTPRRALDDVLVPGK